MNRFSEELASTKTLFKPRFLINARVLKVGAVSVLSSLSATLECGTLFAGDIVVIDVNGQFEIGKIGHFFAANKSSDVVSQIYSITRTAQRCVMCSLRDKKLFTHAFIFYFPSFLFLSSGISKTNRGVPNKHF